MGKWRNTGEMDPAEPVKPKVRKKKAETDPAPSADVDMKRKRGGKFKEGSAGYNKKMLQKWTNAGAGPSVLGGGVPDYGFVNSDAARKYFEAHPDIYPGQGQPRNASKIEQRQAGPYVSAGRPTTPSSFGMQFTKPNESRQAGPEQQALQQALAAYKKRRMRPGGQPFTSPEDLFGIM